MTDKEFDKLIKNSVRLYGDSYDTPDNTEHHFSDKFENNIRILIDGRNIRQNRFKKLYTFMASAAAILIIGVTGFIAFNTIGNNNKNFTEITNSSSTSTDSITERSSSSQSEKSESTKSLNQGESLFPHDNTITNNAAAAEDAEPDNTEKFGIKSESADQDYSISITYKGKSISVNKEKSNKITSLALNYVSDYDKVVKTAFVEENFEYYRNEGFYITISGKDNQPVTVDEAKGTKFDKIILMTDNSKGYAIASAEYDTVFIIPDAKSLYQQLSDITEQE